MTESLEPADDAASAVKKMMQGAGLESAPAAGLSIMDGAEAQAALAANYTLAITALSLLIDAKVSVDLIDARIDCVAKIIKADRIDRVRVGADETNPWVWGQFSDALHAALHRHRAIRTDGGREPSGGSLGGCRRHRQRQSLAWPLRSDFDRHCSARHSHGHNSARHHSLLTHRPGSASPARQDPSMSLLMVASDIRLPSPLILDERSNSRSSLLIVSWAITVPWADASSRASIHCRMAPDRATPFDSEKEAEAFIRRASRTPPRLPS
jgi:hypothetical protein